MIIHPEHDHLVIKRVRTDKEAGDRDCIGHNWNEWNVWRWYPQYRQWLAPCVSISPDGRALVQLRGTPAEEEDIPDEIPDVLEDVMKASHWVWIDGVVRLCDYGHEIIMHEVRQRRDEPVRLKVRKYPVRGPIKKRKSRGAIWNRMR